MSDLNATTPRIFLARHGRYITRISRRPTAQEVSTPTPGDLHVLGRYLSQANHGLSLLVGETEWTISGQHTGISDIPLTPLGERQVTATGTLLVGPGKLLDPKKIARIWVSPRQRAVKTFQLLFGGASAESPNDDGGRQVAGISEEIFAGGEDGKQAIIVTEEIREWDYGDYEGRKAAEVREDRRKRGLDREGQSWSVWRDGCEGGESKGDIEARLDRLIDAVKDVQRPHMKGSAQGDVVLVAHGLILRCFAKRWLRLPVDGPLPMMFSPGSIAVLSYKDHDINKPSFYLGLSLPVT